MHDDPKLSAMLEYCTKPKHRENVRAFAAIFVDYPALWRRLSQPNAAASPTHWALTVVDLTGYHQYIDFWPHIPRACVSGQRSVKGIPAIEELLDHLL